MNNCERLKEAIGKTGLGIKQFAPTIDVSEFTIRHLLKNEKYWDGMKESTAKKIHKFFDDIANGTYKADQKAIKPKKKELNKTDVRINKTPKVHKTINETSDLTESDSKTLTLIECAYDGLKEAKNNSEFEANVSLMKKILNKY